MLSPAEARVFIDITGQPDLNSALKALSKEAIENRIKKVNEQIKKFEEKYGMKFEEFKDRWERGEICNRFSYEVEKDFWEWEALISRKKKLEEAIKCLI
jgi:predicted DNA-binding protein YlxM (UPF0122 family)